MERLYKDRSWLTHRYEDLEESTCKIAKICNCTPRVVWYWLKKFGTKRRSMPEALCLNSNHVKITKGLTEFLGGLLLGDGHLDFNGWTSQYKNISKYESYLEWLKGKFEYYGIGQSGRIRKREGWQTFPGSRDRLTHVITFFYTSKRYVELEPFHRKWYRKLTELELLEQPKRKWIKTIPSDLKLTPLVCLMWYLGDGSTNKDGHYSSLATQGFTIKEVDFLIKLLDKEGFRATRRTDGSIAFTVASTEDFLDYVGKCPVKCYEYRWQVQKYEKAVKALSLVGQGMVV